MKLLNVFDQRFEEFIVKHAATLSKFHPRSILDYVFGREKLNKKEVKWVDYVDDYFTKIVLSNRELSSGTLRNYKKSINHLKTYLKLKRKESLILSNLDKITVIEFKGYLQCSSSPDSKSGMTEVSASSTLKNFKPIFNRAVEEGHLTKNPFMDLKLKHKSPRRDRLAITHVKALYDLDLTRFPAQKAYRDIFLFSVFTGLAYKDAMSLKYTHLQERKDGSI